ncbi:MAG: RnfABCDGE type electron transport complex subunit B [Oscillospiraceae bacterium]|nr:RnfABCDGE type electron transport complex subunit B [Oscillospiraceae bacterium]
MNIIVLAVVSVTVIGLICAVVLSIASKVMAVPVNEEFTKIRECLPGANCGACGFAGCDGYAEALASGEEPAVNKCVPGSDGVAAQIAEILGVEAADVIEQVAVIHCRGDCDVTDKRMDYQGVKSCAAAKLFFGGNGKCAYGCLGFGDCASVCPNDAIYYEKGIARVDTRKCVGCGMCAKKCPNSLITIEDDTIKTMVTCSNQDKGAVTRSVCSHGCIGCHKCEKVCPADAITIENFLSKIDYSKCQHCGQCAEVCPTGCIMVADFTGIHNLPKEA